MAADIILCRTTSYYDYFLKSFPVNCFLTLSSFCTYSQNNCALPYLSRMCYKNYLNAFLVSQNQISLEYFLFLQNTNRFHFILVPFSYKVDFESNEQARTREIDWARRDFNFCARVTILAMITTGFCKCHACRLCPQSPSRQCAILTLLNLSSPPYFASQATFLT